MKEDKDEFKVGDYVEYIKRIGDHSIGDTAYIAYISGEFLDLSEKAAWVQDGTAQLQRVRKTYVKKVEE